ncbi:diacylglycerol/lipid kinase family protein [Salinicoccus halitifaciens]|uniref:Diacylglycerol kinase (ATP) n=1 Tax=Salinicoccus halitifaciens TaxID=1073415 RepID=A0ABV2ED02_9STAP|nr:diacylglycerol kinase family protein [Salinicoccus halitifaciens]MCD2137440.1 diacylglycerol kinase family lipid kinase [Salinicoccus halitifaciens]
MKKALLVHNKKSGQSKKHGIEAALIQQLNAAGYEVMVKTTPESGAEGIVSEYAADKDLIVTVGGDGTISEVMNTVLKEGFEIPIAVIPTGTVNDLARVHGIPLDAKKAIRQLGTAVPVPIDIIRLNDRHASYLVALGAFMTAFAEVDARIKHKTGRLAYLFAGIKMLLRLKKYSVTIKTPDAEVHSASVLTIVSKLRSVGSLGRLIKEAGADDGLLHIINIEPVNVFEAVHLIFLAVKGNLTDHEKVTYLTAEKAEISAAGLSHMNIDGDRYDYRDMDISVARGAVLLMKHPK